MKKLLQGVIRGVHAAVLDRGLPDRLGVYFHNLEPSEYKSFENSIRRLRDSGYRFVDAQTYATVPGRGETAKLAYVSFDDNYVDWYAALPLFERLDIPATFYVNTAPMRDQATEAEIEEYFRDRLRYKGTPTRPLNMLELRAIRDAGHTIAVHSHNHFVLSDLPLETAKEEIYICRDHLEQGLGQRMKHFSYPFGMRRHFSKELQEYCLGVGFETIARATPGLLHQKFDGVTIQRTDWHLADSFDSNVKRFSIDGRLFEAVTGRSAVA